MNKTNNSKNIILVTLFAFIISLLIFSLFSCNKVKAFSSTDFDVNSDGEITKIGNLSKDSTTNDGFKTVIDKYKQAIVGIGSFATVTMMLFCILNITKVAAAATNPTARSQAITGVVWTGVAVALLGSVTIWFGFFYNALRGESKP